MPMPRKGIVEGEHGISGMLDSLDTWNACLSWLHWGMEGKCAGDLNKH